MNIIALVALDQYKSGRLEKSFPIGSELNIPRMEAQRLFRDGYARGCWGDWSTEVRLVEQWRYRYIRARSERNGLLTRVWHAIRNS